MLYYVDRMENPRFVKGLGNSKFLTPKRMKKSMTTNFVVIDDISRSYPNEGSYDSMDLESISFKEGDQLLIDMNSYGFLLEYGNL